MDWDDPDLGFAASLLAHACKGGLTDKQSPHAQRIVNRIYTAYSQERLRCQQIPKEHPLLHLDPEGEA
jgi:hypothetical protein